MPPSSAWESWAQARSPTTNIAGAAVVCAPLDQSLNTPVLQQPGIHKNVYTLNLLKGLKERAEEATQRFGSERFDYDRAMAATTIPEFDDAFTAPIWGFGMFGTINKDLNLNQVQQT